MKLPLEMAIEEETHARNTLADRIKTLERELKAERDLRASIAADLRKISELFNQLIAA